MSIATPEGTDVIKTEVQVDVKAMYPDLPVKEGTDVYIVQTSDGLLIEFDTDDGLALLPVVPETDDNGYLTGIRRA